MTSANWETLRQIKRENAEEEARATKEGPLACPIDGAVLEVNSKGTRNCPLGNFRWER